MGRFVGGRKQPELHFRPRLASSQTGTYQSKHRNPRHLATGSELSTNERMWAEEGCSRLSRGTTGGAGHAVLDEYCAIAMMLSRITLEHCHE